MTDENLKTTVTIRLPIPLVNAIKERRKRTGSSLQWLVEGYLTWYVETGRTPWTEGVVEAVEPPLKRLLDADPQALAALIYLAEMLTSGEALDGQVQNAKSLLALRKGGSL